MVLSDLIQKLEVLRFFELMYKYNTYLGKIVLLKKLERNFAVTEAINHVDSHT